MSDEIENWLDRWVEDHVVETGLARVEESDGRSASYVDACVGDAVEKAGWSRAELEAVVGDLQSYMDRAIDHAIGADIKRRQQKRD